MSSVRWLDRASFWYELRCRQWVLTKVGIHRKKKRTVQKIAPVRPDGGAIRLHQPLPEAAGHAFTATELAVFGSILASEQVMGGKMVRVAWASEVELFAIYGRDAITTMAEGEPGRPWTATLERWRHPEGVLSEEGGEDGRLAARDFLWAYTLRPWVAKELGYKLREQVVSWWRRPRPEPGKTGRRGRRRQTRGQSSVVRANRWDYEPYWVPASMPERPERAGHWPRHRRLTEQVKERAAMERGRYVREGDTGETTDDAAKAATLRFGERAVPIEFQRPRPRPGKKKARRRR